MSMKSSHRPRLEIVDFKSKSRKRRIKWIIEEFAEGRKKILSTPTIFASYSYRGNQWLKLLYFIDQWADTNILFNLTDILLSNTKRRNSLLSLGITESIRRQHQDVLNYLKKQAELDPTYSSYHLIAKSQTSAFDGFFFLDSGGFSLGNSSKLTMLMSKGSTDSDLKLICKHCLLSEKRRALGREKEAEKQAAIAERIVMKYQTQIKPHFIISLDRVVDNYELDYSEKANRVFFSLAAAKEALRIKAKRRNFSSLLLAAIHPLGPKRSEIKDSYTKEEAYRIYDENIKYYISELNDIEEEEGDQFDGFAVGSLVPLNNDNLLTSIGKSIVHSLGVFGMRDRPLHGLGCTNDKMELLYEIGFDMFDTNWHVKMARNRRFFHPGKKMYVSNSDIENTSCTCRICRHFHKNELVENRKGVKEVATVLQSLHNFYMNHIEKIEELKNTF